MLIVAGHLTVAAQQRDEFLELSRPAMRSARSAPGCFDFVVAADPVDATRVVIYERWADRQALQAFRGSGPDDDLGGMIRGAEVAEYEVVPVRR